MGGSGGPIRPRNTGRMGASSQVPSFPPLRQTLGPRRVPMHDWQGWGSTGTAESRLEESGPLCMANMLADAVLVQCMGHGACICWARREWDVERTRVWSTGPPLSGSQNALERNKSVGALWPRLGSKPRCPIRSGCARPPSRAIGEACQDWMQGVWFIRAQLPTRGARLRGG